MPLGESGRDPQEDVASVDLLTELPHVIVLFLVENLHQVAAFPVTELLSIGVR